MLRGCFEPALTARGDCHPEGALAPNLNGHGWLRATEGSCPHSTKACSRDGGRLARPPPPPAVLAPSSNPPPRAKPQLIAIRWMMCQDKHPPPPPPSCLSQKTRMPSPRRQRPIYQGSLAPCRSPSDPHPVVTIAPIESLQRTAEPRGHPAFHPTLRRGHTLPDRDQVDDVPRHASASLATIVPLPTNADAVPSPAAAHLPRISGTLPLAVRSASGRHDRSHREPPANCQTARPSRLSSNPPARACSYRSRSGG